MFTSIPKSAISKRSFKTYKNFTVTESDYPVIKVSNTEDFGFDTGSASNTTIGNTTIYDHPTYKSLVSKYYSSNGNILNQFGKTANISNFQFERTIPNTFQIISLPQSKYGEQIKENSLTFTNEDSGEEFVDRDGNIEGTNFVYNLESIDLNEETIVLSDGNGEYSFDILSSLPDEFGIDINEGTSDVQYDGTTYGHNIVSINLEAGNYETQEEIPNPEIQTVKYGNVFYSDGLVVFTDDDLFSEYTMRYKSTHTIYETEVLVEVKENEFNYSQNPSAVVVTLSGSYEFETTPITNVSPAETKTIKVVNDISRVPSYSGSVGLVTGSWDDYYDAILEDPTGSYLRPFITTIGLYDDENNMVAVAKLPQPIKSYPDLPVNFLVRLDT
jgi:hypothetical protein